MPVCQIWWHWLESQRHGPWMLLLEMSRMPEPSIRGISIGETRYDGWERRNHRPERFYWKQRKTARGLQHAAYSQHPEAETRHENGDQSFEIGVVQCA